MRIPAPFDQARGRLNSFAKTDIAAGNAQQFTAAFVIFDNLKPKAHRIESSGKKGFMAKRVEFRHLHPRSHTANILCIISAVAGQIVSRIVMQSTYGLYLMCLSWRTPSVCRVEPKLDASPNPGILHVFPS